MDPRQHFTTNSTGAQHTMSLLRPSIAGRLLRASAPSTRRVVPATIRFESTALGTPLTTSDAPPAGIAKAGEAKDIQPRHNQPDYAAEVDQASS
jgi:NADH dehydrogenase (ubiquinone) Fe-S protein 4